MKGDLMTDTKTDTKCRKYNLTFNNPMEHNASHEIINKLMENFNWIYYCMCDEIGKEGTPHTHLFFQCKNAVHFSKVKKIFPSAHIEEAIGSAADNKNYILKSGKHENTDKAETNLPETFEEYGEIPLSKVQKNETVSSNVYEMIKEGYSNIEIIEEHPSYMSKIQHLDKTRQLMLEESYSKKFRNIEVTYISGKTATGKTRYVMEKYGYDNVYKIINYEHPFDNYNGEDVILFDEFRSSLPLADMLAYLDGYPCRLPARYADKFACFTKAYIISNHDLDKQYPNIQIEHPEDWEAFIRRINKVKIFQFDENPFIEDGEKDVEIIDVPPENYIKGR